MPAPAERCEVCGADLTSQSSGQGRAGRPARYCSSACRQRAYRQRSGTQRPVTQPPAPAPAPVRSTLPAPLDSFVGRERDLAELAALLDRYRLVTLLGPGGAGKTRLAVELATRVRGHYPGGVCLVELAALTDPALLARTVADCLGTGEEIGRPVLDTLVDALSGSRALLVLDNCEHLVVAAAGLAEELLRRCPALTVVATSRESLELPGEAVFRVRELSLPPASRAPTAAEVVNSDAVRLFVERAAASAPDFSLTDDNAPHVAAICTHLDGIPLAIELAARRVRLFGPAEIRSRLADRFRLLTAGPRTAASRHRDLRTTIEWSYDLLEPVEQAVFRRLSVLVGGFGLAVATAVCEADAVGADEMFDLLSALEARSLVVPGAVNGTGSGRFRQLESIRLYGLDRLRASGEEDTTYDRLADYLLGLAEPIVGDGMLHCYEELEPLYVERANLQALLDWTASRRDPRHLALAAALGRCWRHQGYVSDGWTLLRTALDAAGPDHPDRGAALIGAATLVSMGGDYPLAATLGAEAVRLEEERGHPVRLAKALGSLASIHVTGGQWELAYEFSERTLALAPLLANPLDLSVCLHNEAYHMLQAGHADRAGELMEECLPLYRAHSPYPVPPEWLHSAGMLALARDELDTADGHLREALDRYPRVGAAEDLPVTAVDSFDGLAAVAARQGRFVRALRLDAVAEAARWERKLGREAIAEQQRDETLAAARAGLTPDQVRDAERDGSALAGSGAVEYAVSDRWAGHDEAGPALSDRETELARLVAAGLTNRQIASRLRLTERAVEAGLRDLRTTLGLRSRAQLAAWSVEHLG